MTPLTNEASVLSNDKFSKEVPESTADINVGNKKSRLFTSTKDLVKILTPNVLSGSLILGFIWTVLYVFFLCVLAAQTWMMVSDFASHPVTVSISIRSDTFSAQFPTVTLCNNNIARASMLQRVSRYEDLVSLDTFIAKNLDLTYNNNNNNNNQNKQGNGSGGNEGSGGNNGDGNEAVDGTMAAVTRNTHLFPTISHIL